MQAICSLKNTVQQPGTSDADALRSLVQELMRAVQEGRVRLTCCFVKFLPFATEGELVPMRLPCGCTMSRAASRVAAKSGTCQLCYDSVPQDADIKVDMAVLRVVQSERRGVSVPDIQRSRVTLGEWLGEGAQGTVQKGQLASQDGSKPRDVAVKVVRVPDSVKSKDVGALDQVVATTYLASHSPHVCKMHGVSWTEKESWYAYHHISASSYLCIDGHDSVGFQLLVLQECFCVIVRRSKYRPTSHHHSHYV